jgi:hypothetical protein
MTFKPALWRPISLTLSALNLAGAGFAIAAAEPIHASVHVALALAFGFWAQRLGRQRSTGDQDAELGQLEADLGDLRGELGEAQERMDFIERVMTRQPEPRRPDAERDRQ